MVPHNTMTVYSDVITRLYNACITQAFIVTCTAVMRPPTEHPNVKLEAAANPF